MTMIKVNVKDAVAQSAAKVSENIGENLRSKREVSYSELFDLIKDVISLNFEKHIYAALRRHDIQIADGEQLNKEVLSRELGRKAGITLTDITSKDAILSDVDKHICKLVNVAAGTTFTTLVDKEQMQEQIVSMAVQQIESGAVSVLSRAKAKVTTGGIIYREKFEKQQKTTLKKAHRKLMQRIYQKRFERTHEKVWV
ncbi:hypothetical protein LPB67_06100 [Undibacterium sp. Jales W-56]|uniref:hypothetical protein n=1 Tax=Undibacterium sp. Jales W-56 TaxID=2897325 RepID=UPI0021D1E704|nr:hypothetical protein [Undibacterium sp. Jales W-56]MCU6433350.1 hypothetical protein [Undibacterium sp. Jales W-56]